MRKAWADLRVRWWQSGLIALSVAASATLLYVGLAGLFGANAPYERQLARNHGPHAWFYFKDDAAGRDAADRIAGRSEVLESVSRPVAMVSLVSLVTTKAPVQSMQAISPGQPPAMGYSLLEGRDLQQGDRDSLLLAASVARAMHVGVGDTVQVNTEKGARPLTVVGLVADSLSCPFPRCNSQSLYVLPETFDSMELAPDQRSILLGVRLSDPASADVFVSHMRTDGGQAVRDGVSWLFRLDYYQSDRLFSVVPIMLFGIVAVGAAAMILANLIGGAVLGQYREIGVLKALGFSGGQVLLLFVGQTLVLGLVGGVAGIAGGHLLTVRTMAPLARSMGTPDVLHFMPQVATTVLVIVLAVAALFAGLAAWRAVGMRPAAMLADGFAAPRGGQRLPVRVAAALRLPAPALLGIKDAVARPGRSLMTVLSLAVCLIAITLSLGFPKISDQIMSHPEWIGINWDMIVERKAVPPEETVAAVKALPDVRGYYPEIHRKGTVVDQSFDLGIRAVDGDWNDFGFRLLSGRLPRQPGEILIAPAVAERLGLKEGDQIRLQIGDTTLPVTVVGRYQDAMDFGRIALMTYDTFHRFVPGSTPFDYLRVKLKPGADWFAARKQVLEQTGYRPLVYLEEQEVPDFARDALTMMERLAWVMTVIAGVAILGASLLTAKEQMREVGIRKAVGMTPAQVLGAVAVSGAWYGVWATVLALPSATLVLKGLVVAMAKVMGIGQLPLTLSGDGLALAAAVGLSLAVAAVMPAAVWGARLATASVLHAE
jgi:putative ABC transport system permease protein